MLVAGLLVLAAWSQNNYEDFHEKSYAINRTGMYVLGSWAIANMASGAAGWAFTDGATMRFHQMNLFWNTVNLGIAGFGLYTSLKSAGNFMTSDEIIHQHLKMENLYVINAGLDVLYIGAGFYLRHLSTKKPKRHDLFLGYGNSVILQGAFLLVFDAVMWGVQRTNRLDFLQHISFSVVPETAAMKIVAYFPF